MRAPVKYCRAGHEVSGSNVEVNGGRRRCKRCLAEIRARYYQRHKDRINALDRERHRRIW